jgi:DNA-nicking Smr family endonuclease
MEVSMKLQHRLSKRRAAVRFVATVGAGVIIAAIVGLSLILTCKDSAAKQAAASRTFDITSDADFKNYKNLIGQFARKHRPRAANDFCTVGYVAQDNSKLAWVIWRQGREIILWEPQETDLDLSRRKIKLGRDVVNAESDLHGSTYLVTKAWVDDLMSTCDRAGTKVHIGAPKKHRRQ